MNRIKLFILNVIFTCQNIFAADTIIINSILGTAKGTRVRRKRDRRKKKNIFTPPRSQSAILDLQPKRIEVFNFVGKSQSTKLDEKLNRSIRIAFTDDRAYWIHDSSFYTADVIDGRVDPESAIIIDMFTASDKDLEMYLAIIDGLKE